MRASRGGARRRASGPSTRELSGRGGRSRRRRRSGRGGSRGGLGLGDSGCAF